MGERLDGILEIFGRYGIYLSDRIENLARRPEWVDAGSLSLEDLRKEQSAVREYCKSMNEEMLAVMHSYARIIMLLEERIETVRIKINERDPDDPCGTPF